MFVPVRKLSACAGLGVVATLLTTGCTSQPEPTERVVHEVQVVDLCPNYDGLQRPDSPEMTGLVYVGSTDKCYRGPGALKELDKERASVRYGKRTHQIVVPNAFNTIVPQRSKGIPAPGPVPLQQPPNEPHRVPATGHPKHP